MLIAKVLRISGDTALQIEETAALLQDFIDKTSPADLRKLLVKAKEKPSVIKTALKFV
jgi:hypothetical protein